MLILGPIILAALYFKKAGADLVSKID